MSSASENNKRIARNTLLLYFRMLFTMGVSLYTSRVVLNVLGIEDFGIYNVVGGAVAMFSILSGSLSSAISRFLTFELGKNNTEKLKKIFSVSVNIQLIIAVAVFILAESVGIWFLNTKMNIPHERVGAAMWVFQCSILTFMINLISVPYNAVIIAHEQMKAFAYISILEVSLKLIIVFLLVLATFDKLIVYAFLLLLIAFIIRLTYGIYCKRHFVECSYRFLIDRDIFKCMLSFAGWNFIGSSSAILKTQGVNLVLNLFYGPIVNAAQGISVQVQQAVFSFVSNFQMAINPQIIKKYASGDVKSMMILVFQGTRFSYYLLFILSLPILLETEFVLTLWLRIVPSHTVAFVKLVLLLSLCDTLSGTLITVQLATGKIRNYQIIVGGLQMMNLPVSYLFLRMGYAPEVTVIVAIFISLVCLFTRLVLLRRMVAFQSKLYLKEVILRVLLVSLISSLLPYWVYSYLKLGVWNFVFLSLVCLTSSLTVIYFVGLSTIEKIYIKNKVKNQFYRIFQ